MNVVAGVVRALRPTATRRQGQPLELRVVEDDTRSEAHSASTGDTDEESEAAAAETQSLAALPFPDGVPMPQSMLVNGSYVDGDTGPEITCIACYTRIKIYPTHSLPPPPPAVTEYSTPPGITLPCPYAHAYCLTCLHTCIATKLEDGRKGRRVFPMQCPSCPVEYRWCFIDSAIASAVLNEPELDDFKQQEYLESLPKMYCPNRTCSEVLQLPDTACDGNEAECPACNVRVCVPCRTISHPGMSCAAWLKSPLNVDPEELTFRKLAKRYQWRRCTACRMIVERTEGCSHITCRCGREFCHQCGSDWIGGCQNPGSCGWKNDATLYIPGKFATFIRETAGVTRRTVKNVFTLGFDKRREDLVTPMRAASTAKRWSFIRITVGSRSGACG